MMRTSPQKHGYNLWLGRVHRVIEAYQAKRINGEDLHHFQRFILEFGELNANFTLEELKSLNYPKSPFNIMHRHTYLRSTETWATEILRQLHSESYPSSNHAYPVFIDSDLFWSEVTRYVTVISSKDVLSGIDYIKTITDNLTSDVWICLQSPDDEQITKSKIRLALENSVIETKIPEKFREVFKRKNNFTKDEKKFLDSYLNEELENCRKKLKKNNASQPIRDESKLDGKVFGMFKKYNSLFLSQNNIKTLEQLQDFSQKNMPLFKKAYEELGKNEQVSNELKDSALYLQAIQDWLNLEVSARLKRFYYYMSPQEKFLGIDTLVLVGHKKAKFSDTFGPKKLINRLGYRVEMGRVVTAVLNKFPLLFFDVAQTRQFWGQLMKVPMITSLPTSEQEIIGKLCDHIFEAPQVREEIRFDYEYESFKKACVERVFGFYRQFILDYLFHFLKFHRKDSVIYDVLIPELYDSMKEFLSAYRESFGGNLPTAIRAVQTIAEILRLDLAFFPYDSERDLMSLIKNKLLKDHPAQFVLMAPYGMRAYLRVIQASNLAAHSTNKTNVCVTNQNYFEWLLNLKSLRSEQVGITHVRQLEDIDRSVDYIFTEIHPNNVTEKKQFPQNLSNFIKRMLFENWSDKQRTLVVDATLDALDHPEVQTILNLAKPCVNMGLLNIVIMQSLTKFSQIGLDQRSGGITVVINNGKSWETFNTQFQLIAEKEPIEKSTILYFSHFFSSGLESAPGLSLTVKYITRINHNVNQIYDMFLEEQKLLGDDNPKFFRLTSSMDAGSCYLSFNTGSILSYIDPDFKYTVHDIEKLNEDIIKYIFIPLCRKCNLPISARMSIAFPLSSVNVALDSIRFTVGLEGYQDLKKYARIFAYLSHSMNFSTNLTSLFETNEKRVMEFNQITRGFEELFEVNQKDLPERRTRSEKVPNININSNPVVYGPFNSIKGPVYFLYDKNDFYCCNRETIYSHERIVLCQENIITSYLKLSVQELDYFLCGSGYIKQPGAMEFLEKHPKCKLVFNAQYLPLPSDRTNIIFLKEGIALERDYVCVRQYGMTIFKRAFSPEATAIEMDYWQEKDPIVSRFITFVIALYVHKKYGAEFKVRGEQNAQSSLYIYFLFKMKYENANECFSNALEVVHKKRSFLLEILEKHIDTKLKADAKPFLFHSYPEPGDPYDTSIYNGPCQFEQTFLIDNIFTALGLKSVNAAEDNKLLIRSSLFHEKSRPSSAKDTIEVLSNNVGELKLSSLKK